MRRNLGGEWEHELKGLALPGIAQIEKFSWRGCSIRSLHPDMIGIEFGHQGSVEQSAFVANEAQVTAPDAQGNRVGLSIPDE